MSEPAQTPENEPLNEQRQADGSGTLFERRYWVDVKHPTHSPEALVAYLTSNFNEFSPNVLARFEKTEGEEADMEVDDEFHIRILGPWNGSVRVTAVGERSFEFVTLEGHPEAGTIRFRASDHPDFPQTLHFEIRSLARARDGLVAFAHEKLGVGMWVQEKMWLTFCRRVADFIGGERLNEPQSSTVSRDQGSWWATE